ncbi:1,5-anhydro-D-fructose reductase [Thalassovita gelatinovora]|uniref:1,5-anhydro-D-fructose reductase n=1 Tax=Thalassovita gelatinovora TaxID=53501 RepID=A0A0P1F9C1_THAGE|nr:Gfo/Idh/MocA family oxidoreductase [Thalassovita gelatinovora]QIZ81173.1 Gfo/Idh/MocA family oxidoreductase [Thalassovita gelatinovora]CUH64775.1 1,5-anhydro-D-fructose reductase [Thalassovita gelatinovora]SEP92264.1 Predicted dehydrogenase [Thalassovita gelatinovora]
MSSKKIQGPAVALIGCGFVADLYMRSLQSVPHVQVVGAFDIDVERAGAFSAHWGVTRFAVLEDLFAALPRDGVVLNLTNPDAHFEVNRACLQAGFHTYSEKPLAMRMDQARDLHQLASEKGLLLASAPCSVLGQAAQTLAHAVRNGVAGTPRLIYAELDDGFIPQAPVESWISESGAPWPYEDEFRVGCTLEHAGYYLGWLIAMFGTVRRVVAASGQTIPDKKGITDTAPDFSVATLFFETGPMVRLTCSIVAPHDHRIRVIGDKGVLQVKKAWANGAPVKFHKRFRIRRRLIDSPLGKRVSLHGPSHPMVGRWGAASMNFALGPVEMLGAIAENRPCRLSADFALHLNEVTLAIQNAGDQAGAQVMTTRCDPMEPMQWAR